MIRRPQALALSIILFGILCANTFGDAAASPLHKENISLNSDVFTQPEYVEALAKELEKEALTRENTDGHLKKNLHGDFNGGDFIHSKKLTNRRNSESPDPPKRYTEAIYYPAELLNMGNRKRNFDEIDQSGFSGFNKRNFDEIDRSGFSGFNKRNIDEIDRNAFSGFSKRNFDEIDRSGFSGFNKRNFDEMARDRYSNYNKRNFDEIDRSGFSGFNKRNIDEIDRNGFSGFSKRNFDEIDRSGVPGFAKRSLISRSNGLTRPRH